MSVKRINAGARMSSAVVHGNTVYLAGLTADDAKADVKGQTKQILDKIDKFLAEAGTDKSKILSANIWLTDIGTWGQMNEVWDAWVAPGFEPMDADGRLPGIVVPVQAIQGEDDEYGSELQLGIIAGKVGGYCETRLVPDCGHSPHLQQPAYVLSEITRFVAPLALVG